MDMFPYSLNLLLKNSPGRTTRIPNLSAALKFRTFNVIKTSAAPFIAVSNTISSPGSAL